MVCRTCGCDDFKANPFQKARCKVCSHNHGDGSAEAAAVESAKGSVQKPVHKASTSVQSRLARFRTAPVGGADGTLRSL